MLLTYFDCQIFTRFLNDVSFFPLFATGDLQLLTYKAACASHMYGQEFEYVVKTYTCLQKANDRDLFMFLQLHLQNSIGLHLNFERRTR